MFRTNPGWLCCAGCAVLAVLCCWCMWEQSSSLCACARCDYFWLWLKTGYLALRYRQCFVKHQRLVTPCARVLILQCDRSIYCALNTALMAASEARISGDCEAASTASGSGPRPRRPSRPCRGRWGDRGLFISWQRAAQRDGGTSHLSRVTCQYLSYKLYPRD